MKITTKNYFATLKKVGFDNLPLALKQSHTVILTKTVNGEDWSKYKLDKDFKSMVDLTFKKLEEFSNSKKQNLNGITAFNPDKQLALDILHFLIHEKKFDIARLKKMHIVIEVAKAEIIDGNICILNPKGHPLKIKYSLDDLWKELLDGRANNNYETVFALKDNLMKIISTNKKNNFSAISKEIHFISRFLDFNDKIIYKKTFEIFIDELQKAIQDKKITKKSPVAKDIMEIQTAVLSAFNTMSNAKHFNLKPITVKHLKGIIEKYENAYDDIDTDYIKVKKKPMGLSGINSETITPVITAPINMMKSTDFINMKFNTLGFKDKWLEFIGDPSAGFTMMVFGMPKFGKSYLCVDLAGYLARNHGKVLYVAKEEKLDRTLQDKLKDKNVAHDNLTVADAIPNDLSKFDFVFLDSVNKLRLSPEDLERLKASNKGKSFIYIFQATKGGQFKGNNEFQHDVDVVVEVPEIGKAIQYGRFNQGGEMNIFE